MSEKEINDTKKDNYHILKVKTSQTAAIKKMIKKLKKFSEYLNISFIGTNTMEKITINNLSDDRSAFVKIDLNASNLEKFYCKDQVIKAGVRTEEFYSILKTLDNNEPLVFYMDDDSRNILHIRGTINDIHHTNFKTDTVIRLVDHVDPIMSPKQIEFQNVFTIDSEKFYKICDLCDSFDYITITTCNKSIIFNAKNESDVLHLSYENTRNNNQDNNRESVQVKGTYELPLLKIFSEFYKLCNEINIYHKNNFSTVLRIPITNLGYMYCFIEPVETRDTQ